MCSFVSCAPCLPPLSPWKGWEVVFTLRTSSSSWNINTKCRIRRGCAECIRWRKWIPLLADSFPCMNCRLSFPHLFNWGWIIFLNYKSYSNNTHLNLLLYLLCFPSVLIFWFAALYDKQKFLPSHIVKPNALIFSSD